MVSNINELNIRHIHADVIIAWANGAEIELKTAYGEWEPVIYTPTWENWKEYRIKPQPKPDIRKKLWGNPGYLIFVFDGETKEFKTAEYHNDE